MTPEASFVEVLTLQTRATRRLPIGAMGNHMDLSWSLDGRFFAFVRAVSRNESVTRLWVMRSSDGEAFPVNDGTSGDWSPTWSPDSRSFYFLSTRGGSMDLWQRSIGVDGRPAGESVALTVGVGMQQAALTGIVIDVDTEPKPIVYLAIACDEVRFLGPHPGSVVTKDIGASGRGSSAGGRARAQNHAPTVEGRRFAEEVAGHRAAPFELSFLVPPRSVESEDVGCPCGATLVIVSFGGHEGDVFLDGDDRPESLVRARVACGELLLLHPRRAVETKDERGTSKIVLRPGADNREIAIDIDADAKQGVGAAIGQPEVLGEGLREDQRPFEQDEAKRNEYKSIDGPDVVLDE